LKYRSIILYYKLLLLCRFFFLLLFIIQFVYALCGNITRLCLRASLWIVCVCLGRAAAGSVQISYTHDNPWKNRLVTRAHNILLLLLLLLLFGCSCFHSVIGSWNNTNFKYSRILAKLLRSLLLESVC